MTLLQVQALSLQRGGRSLLQGLTFDVSPGEFVAVVGPNGAGKSSLLKALCAEWPIQGDVVFDGRSVCAWPRDQLAKRLAVMTQQATLSFDFSVREVVALGRLPHRGAGAAADNEVVDAVLESLKLQALADRDYPSLSGGERQRVQFARAAAQLWQAQAPSVLLLDEPTSALDLAQQRCVLGWAHQMSLRGTAVIAVLHDLNLAARHADRVLMLKNGHLVAQGCPHDVLEPTQIQAVFGVPVDRQWSSSDQRPVLVMLA